MSPRRKRKGKKNDESLIPLDRFITPPSGQDGDSGGAITIERPSSEEIPGIEKTRKSGEKIFDAQNIDHGETSAFLNPLKKYIEKTMMLGIYFHNDMDGLNSAILINEMVRNWFGDEVQIHVSPIEYEDIEKLTINDGMAYVFCDMDINLDQDNIFRIDHHDKERDRKLVNERTFLLSPSRNDYEYPSSATILSAYLNYVSKGGELTFHEFMEKGPWHDDNLTRLLILLASICDNLWHLNFIINIPIKRWIPDIDEERNLILISISASLILGNKNRMEPIMNYFSLSSLDPESYLTPLCGMTLQARNVFDFAVQVAKEAEKFHNKIFFNLTDSLEKTLKSLDRDMEMLKKYDESMPMDMRGNREKMMELLNTRGNLNEDHWKRIQFYGKEMVKLEAKIKVEEKKILKLRTARSIISKTAGPRICLFIPRQVSKQIKGILASLLYYMGWKNVVIEDRGNVASWGARGFTRAEVTEHFSTLSLGYEELKDYLHMEKVYKDLPAVFKRTLNISRNMGYDKTYSGGIGGRGLIYGGTLTGKVPRVFSLLEEAGDVEQKIRELIRHKELGSALQGLTEGKSMVPTSQALKSKFKNTGWVVVQLVGGKEEPDVQFGNFNMGLMYMVGYTERFAIKLNPIPEKLPPMEHQRFDGVLD
ncbi:MAG: hypothetical protein ACMUIG_00145 [Thermoplasmatota archaeon]